MARKFTEEGAQVILCGRNEETLKKASEELGGCAYHPLDVTHAEQFEGFFEQAEKEVGKPIDTLVSNAGISLHEHSFEEVKESDFDRQFATNLKGPYFLSQAFIRYCLARKKDGQPKNNILFMSSERGFWPDTIPYGLTKVALNSLTEGLAKRYIYKGIRVNAIAPGVTASDMTQVDKNGELYREDNIGGRALLPEEIAEAATFLLSDAAASINGTILPCNLGNHLR